MAEEDVELLLSVDEAYHAVERRLRLTEGNSDTMDVKQPEEDSHLILELNLLSSIDTKRHSNHSLNKGLFNFASYNFQYQNGFTNEFITTRIFIPTKMLEIS